MWDASLAGTPPGTYAVRVSADEPVVSAVELIRRGDPTPQDPDVPVLDRAWLPSVRPATDLVVMTPGLGDLVEGVELVIADTTASGAEVTLRPVTAAGTFGVDLEAQIPPDGAVAVSQEDLSALVAGDERIVGVLVTSQDPLAAAALLTATDDLGEQVSAVPGQPDPQVARSVSLRFSIS